MKKTFWMLCLAVMIFSVSYVRADVRSDSLNTDPRFIDDVDLIWFYPNLVTQYKNLFDSRTNGLSFNNVWGGLIDGEHKELGVIGVYVNRPFGYDGTRTFNFGAPGWNGTGIGGPNGNWQIGANNWTAPNVFYTGHFRPNTPENKLDAFWGTGDEKNSFGVQVNYADAEGNVNGTSFPLGSSWDQDSSNNSSSAAYKDQKAFGDSRVLGVNLGLGTTEFGPFSNTNVHLGYSLGMLDMEESRSPGSTPDTDTNSLKDNGVFTLTLGALARKDLDENSSMKMFADLYLDQDNQTEHLTHDSNSDGLHNDANDIDEQFVSKYGDVIATLGAGCNHKVLDGKGTISSGFMATWINDDTKLSATQQDAGASSSTVIPQTFDDQTHDLWDLDWNVGVEAKVASWLVLRAGINRPIIWRVTAVTTVNTWAGNTIQSTAKTTVTNDGYFGTNSNPSDYSFGLGANFENFQLDVRASTTSLFGDIASVAPGRGFFFSNSAGTSNTLTTADADIRYQF